MKRCNKMRFGHKSLMETELEEVEGIVSRDLSYCNPINRVPFVSKFEEKK